jgi:hypothetical protein
LHVWPLNKLSATDQENSTKCGGPLSEPDYDLGPCQLRDGGDRPLN